MVILYSPTAAGLGQLINLIVNFYKLTVKLIKLTLLVNYIFLA